MDGYSREQEEVIASTNILLNWELSRSPESLGMT
jgi:hypothetical protein